MECMDVVEEPVTVNVPTHSPRRPLSLPLPQREKYALRASTLKKSKEAEEARLRAAVAASQKKVVKDALTDILSGLGTMHIE